MASTIASTSAYVFPAEAAPPQQHHSSAEEQEPMANLVLTATSDEDEDRKPLGKPLAGITLGKDQAIGLSGGRLKRYMCSWPGCGKCYTRPTRLEEHQRTHTGERPFKCDHCDAAFGRASHLKAHLRTHDDQSKKACVCTEPGCDKKFWTNQHLKKHIEVVHQGKTHNCTHCGETFRKHRALRDHVAESHLPPGTKPFVCEHAGCGRSFAQRTHLKSHERTHDLSRYACFHPDCADRPAEERQFGTWTHLQKHSKQVHPPTCPHPECNGQTFTTRRGLRHHLAIHNRDDDDDDDVLPGAEGEGESTEEGGRAGKKRRPRFRRRMRKRAKKDYREVIDPEDEAPGDLSGGAAGDSQSDDAYAPSQSGSGSGEEELEDSDWEAQQEAERDQRMREDFRHGGKRKRRILQDAAGFPPLLSRAAPSANERHPTSSPPPVAAPAPAPAPAKSVFLDFVTGANYAPPSRVSRPRSASASAQARGGSKSSPVRPAAASAPMSRVGTASSPASTSTSLRRFPCPFPAILAMPFKDIGPSRLDGDQDPEDRDEADDEAGLCRYWFKRVYDVERHLRAKHGVELEGGRPVLDEWFRAEQSAG